MIKPKLGQHFLKNQGVLEKIVKSADLKPNDRVLEIGPGKGILTKKIEGRVRELVKVEKDPELAKLTNALNQDILEFPLPPKDFKIIGNIPYYITGKILKKFAGFFCVYLVQREVAKRILARDGKESILSISIKQWGTPEIVGKVSKNSFSPPPKVDSAILRIIPLGKSLKIDMKVVKKAFSEKRKQIGNTLPKSIIQESGITRTKRPEDLTLKEWITLSKTKD